MKSKISHGESLIIMIESVFQAILRKLQIFTEYCEMFYEMFAHEELVSSTYMCGIGVNFQEIKDKTTLAKPDYYDRVSHSR